MQSVYTSQRDGGNNVYYKCITVGDECGSKIPPKNSIVHNKGLKVPVNKG